MRSVRFSRRQRQEQQLRAVADFGLRALAARRRTDLLEDAVETAARGLEAEYAGLLELQPDQTTLILRAGYGLPEGIEGTVLPLGAESPATQTLRTKDPILVEDWALMSEDTRGDFLRDRGVASSATMAILVDDEPYGVLGAHSTRARAFRADDLFFLRSLGNLVASAIARERTLESAQHLAAIVESSEDAIIGKALDGTITSWNAGAERMYGYEAEEVIGESVALLVPPDRPDELPEILRRLRQGERIGHLETVRLRKDGHRLHVALAISPIMDAAGSIVGASTIARDVTERDQAEAERRRSDERYRELFENATDLIAVTDLESRLASVNKAFARTLGYEQEELIGKPLAELVPPKWHDRLRTAHVSKLSDESASTVYQHELLTKDGRLIQVEVSSRLIEEEGRPVGTEAICRDITERQQLEEQLRQSQRVESVGRLAGGIAHDFNNLLTVIAGYTEALLNRKNAADERELTEIAAAAERAAILTHQLLAFSRRQVLQPTVLDLNEVVAGTTQMLARLLGERIEIVSSLDPAIAPVLADFNQLEQILVNLAINSRDAMPNGGTLRIETGGVELDHRYVSNHPEATVGPHTMLAVSDTGIGMEPATMANIFEPFFTTKPLGIGTGLGLATVHGIVRQSGGNIWVYSEPGRGTTFKVYLPISEASLSPRQSSDYAASPTGDETILIVEDERALRVLVVQMLEEHGYQALAAGTAEQAIGLIGDDDIPIDLVLTDLVMPGMNGRDLAEQARVLRPGIRVLFMSGYADVAVLSNGALEPGSAFLEKPFSASELAHKVREVLDG